MLDQLPLSDAIPRLLFAALRPPDEPLGKRLAVLAVCIAFGAWMIFVGRHNVRTRQAQEAGKRALWLSLMGKSTDIRGRWAVATGWIRIFVGVLAILFGFAFLFFGAFLRQ